MDAEGFVRANLRGMGQIMFQRSEVCGLFFLAAVLAFSHEMFAGAVLGLVVGTVAAIAMKYGGKDVEDGLYGFNGALVGAAMFFFLVPDAAVLLLVVDGAIISTLLMNRMKRAGIAPYTFPFVVSAWLMLLFAYFTGGTAFIPHTMALENYLDAVPSVALSFGQVMFLGSLVSGALAIAGVGVSSLRSLAYALAGALSCLAIALLFGFPLSLINTGIYGYNGVLAGIALSGRRRNPLMWAVAGAALSAMILFAFQVGGIIALTAPFVFATWCANAVADKID